jgi:hypothetical protein
MPRLCKGVRAIGLGYQPRSGFQCRSCSSQLYTVPFRLIEIVVPLGPKVMLSALPTSRIVSGPASHGVAELEGCSTGSSNASSSY